MWLRQLYRRWRPWASMLFVFMIMKYTGVWSTWRHFLLKVPFLRLRDVACWSWRFWRSVGAHNSWIDCEHPIDSTYLTIQRIRKCRRQTGIIILCTTSPFAIFRIVVAVFGGHFNICNWTAPMPCQQLCRRVRYTSRIVCVDGWDCSILNVVVWLLVSYRAFVYLQ